MDGKGRKKMLEITINGEIKSYQNDKLQLKALIQDFGVDQKRYAVEINERIIPKSEHDEYIISNGDVIEIVTAVGGG